MRVKSLLLTLALSFVMARSLAVSFTSDGITYVANADTAIIKGYSAIPESGELTLATTVNYEGKDYRVTTVQNSAFLSCTELKKLVVPSTIKYIQAGAFENCVNMSQLVLSEGEDMLDAASDAFKNCGIEEAEIGRNLKESIFRKSESLVSVKLTKNVTTIPSYAFSNCKKLSSINLENVRQIGEDAFCYCLMLKEINIANIEKIEREAFYGVGVEKVELPETLVELSFQSFAYCKSLKQVCIKGNLHEIPQYCFIGCSSLESIELSLSISKICYDAFRDCTSLNLISWGSVNIIQSDAFENTGFEEICLPKTLCELQFDSFLNCRNLKKIDLSKTQLETVNGFERCVSLEQVIFPDNLREIGKGCFSGCSALEDLHFPTNLEIVSDMAFSGMKKIKSIDFSCTKVHTIPYCCFYNCISLETVTLNALTDSICDSAFMNCSNLSYLSNTSNVQIVCKDAFKGTLLFTEDKIGPMMIGTAMYKYGGKIESKEYVVPSNVTCLCDGVFANQNFQTIKLNEGLKYVGSGAFDNCKKIVSLSIPGTVTHVKGSVGCSSLSLLSIQEGEEALSLEEFSGTLIKKVVLKRNLSASCDWMPNLESLTIGKNVTNLWGNSFESSLHLSNLEILDSSDKLSLGTLPVEGVKTLYLGRNIYDLLPRKNSDTFNSFKELSDFTIGEGVDSICDNFAANNTKLETLTLDKNISYVGHSAFSGAVNLKSLTISPNVKTVDESAFWGLEKLEKVVFFDGLENIGASAFAFNNKKTLPYIYVPKTIKNMGASSFLAIKCNKIVFPEGLQVIGHNAFSNVQTDSIVLPSSIKKMHESFTFSGIKFVDASKIKCNLNSSFYENRQLEKIILPNEGLTDLTENEFWYCSSLSNIDLPCTIKTIAHDAFSATMIEKLHIPSSVTTVGDGILRQTYDTKKESSPIIYIDGCLESALIELKRTFQDDYGLALGKLDVSKNFCYDFSDMWASASSILNVDSLIIRNIKEFTIKTTLQSHFSPTTAICLSPYLTSCDRWKPTSGKVLVLPGSQLPKDDITEMYTVNKLTYEQPADGDVLFDGVNNMPFEITPVFYRENQEVALKEAGDYDLSMKISGTSFDGIYPTGLKVTVSIASGIDNISAGAQQHNCPIYNLNGQRVDDSYKGVVIQNGKKRIAK